MRSTILKFVWLFFLEFPSRRLSATFDIQAKTVTSLTLEANSEAYSEPCQTSKIEVVAQMVTGF